MQGLSFCIYMYNKQDNSITTVWLWPFFAAIVQNINNNANANTLNRLLITVHGKQNGLNKNYIGSLAQKKKKKERNSQPLHAIQLWKARYGEQSKRKLCLAYKVSRCCGYGLWSVTAAINFVHGL